eukprot:gene16766-19934_t
MTQTKTFGHCTIELVEGTDDIYLFKMDDEENKFNDTNIKNMNDAMDYLLSIETACCVISIGMNPKFYSTGLDLDWALPRGPLGFKAFVITFQNMLARLLEFPIPTISIINGHAFAGGAMLAIAHDFRVMRKDRGFFCLPEVDIHIPLTPGMNSILQSKISNAMVFRDAALLGKRFSGDDSKKCGIVDVSTTQDQLMEEALRIAKAVSSKGKDRVTFASLKREMWKRALVDLRSEDMGESAKLTIPPAAL